MANQYAQRDWKQELAETAGRLEMCVVLPKHLTANARVRCSCPHGVVKDTTVVRLIERQFCCKSQASKAHDSEKKRRAANTRWSNPFATNPPQTPESNLKRSKTITQTIKNKREKGWIIHLYFLGRTDYLFLKERKVIISIFWFPFFYLEIYIYLRLL